MIKWLLRSIACVMAAAVTQGYAWAAEGHGACDTCHSGAHTQSDLLRPGDELCARCHQGHRGAGNHQVGMAVPEAARLALPAPGGKVACITCHDPHKPGLGLRLQEDALCNECHRK